MEREKPLGTGELWKSVEIILKQRAVVKYLKDREVIKTWRAIVGAQDNTKYFPQSELTLAEISGLK